MVGIKRPQHEQEVREQESESVTMANVLMLLSRAAEHKETPPTSPGAAEGRVFECKTCNRQFPTFQALGGHRASHKKPRAGAEAAEGEVPAEKPRVHECSVCGLEFTVGQALGGHMRRHRAATVAKTTAEVGEKKGGEGGRRVMWMDLNLTPMENDLVMRKMSGIGVDGIGDWTANFRNKNHVLNLINN